MTHNAHPLKLRPLAADHPLNDPTPTWVHAVTDAMLALMRQMCQVARHEAKQTASPTGWYHVGVLVNADGMMMCDEKGVPLVVPSPQFVMAIDPTPGNRTVVFAQPNQLVKRSEAAKIAGTSVSTIKRAEANGELRAEKVSERDTSYWMADLNGWMLRRSLANDEK